MEKECMLKEDCLRQTGQCYNQNIKPMMEKIDKIDEKVDTILLKLSENREQILNETDKRYAGKITEKIVYTGAGLVLTAFVMALWELIKK